MKSDEHGPDNPRSWDPNHFTLTGPGAPHETACVLRMQRNGWPGKVTMRKLKLRGTRLMRAMQDALDAETRAAYMGRQIHDAKFKIERNP